MKKLKLSIIGIFLAAGLLIPVAVPTSAGAQIDPNAKNAACEGLGAANGGSCNGTAGTQVSNLVARAVEIFSWIIGIAAVIMVIIGGFKFVTSSGDSSGVQSARNTIIYALVGLVIAALAQVLVRFVLSRV